jgi:hypothetical protein
MHPPQFLSRLLDPLELEGIDSTDGAPIATSSFNHPGPTTLSPTFPRSGSSVGPFPAASSTNTMLDPDPPHDPRWLDLTTIPGEPAVRIDLTRPPDTATVTAGAATASLAVK